MLRWTLKTLLQQRSSLWGGAAGVASAFVLVIIFDAVFTGESEQIVSYVRHTDADIWVMQQGVSNMHMTSSFVWDWKADKVAAVEGVSQVTPILYLNTVLKAGGRNWFSYVVGLQSGSTRGGPWALAAGRGDPKPGEAVVPSVLAKTAGIGVGDTILITDETFAVVGLSKGTFSMANSVTFVAFSDLEAILSAVGTVSYLLVDAAPGVDLQALATHIEQNVDKVKAMPRDEFIDSDYEMAMQMGVEIIALMSVIGSALAAMIIAFTAYSYVSRKRKELAILKALGVRNAAIYGSVVMQTSLITIVGFLLAVAFAYGVMPVISTVVPQVTLVVTLTAVMRLGALAILITIAASLLPAYLVARVDPMTAFAA